MEDKQNRNPTWNRDELIVTLDFYVRCGGIRLQRTAFRSRLCPIF